MIGKFTEHNGATYIGLFGIDNSNDYNDLPIVQLNPNDLHIHSEHGERRSMLKMPRVQGTGGTLFYTSCLGDTQKAVQIASFVSDGDSGKGIGVIHSRGGMTWVTSKKDRSRLFRNAHRRPFLRTFRDGTSDHGEDMDLSNSENEPIFLRINPYATEIYRGFNPIIFEKQNNQAKERLHKVLLPFYKEFAEGRLSEEELSKKIDTIANNIGIVHTGLLKKFKEAISPEKIREKARKNLLPTTGFSFSSIYSSLRRRKHNYLEQLYRDYIKGIYTPEEYTQIKEQLGKEDKNCLAHLESLEENKDKIKVDLEHKIYKKLYNGNRFTSYKVEDLHASFVNSDLNTNIKESIDALLDKFNVVSPELRKDLSKSLRNRLKGELDKLSTKEAELPKISKVNRLLIDKIGKVTASQKVKLEAISKNSGYTKLYTKYEAGDITRKEFNNELKLLLSNFEPFASNIRHSSSSGDSHYVELKDGEIQQEFDATVQLVQKISDYQKINDLKKHLQSLRKENSMSNPEIYRYKLVRNLQSFGELLEDHKQRDIIKRIVGKENCKLISPSGSIDLSSLETSMTTHRDAKLMAFGNEENVQAIESAIKLVKASKKRKPEGWYTSRVLLPIYKMLKKHSSKSLKDRIFSEATSQRLENSLLTDKNAETSFETNKDKLIALLNSSFNEKSYSDTAKLTTWLQATLGNDIFRVIKDQLRCINPNSPIKPNTFDNTQRPAIERNSSVELSRNPSSSLNTTPRKVQKTGASESFGFVSDVSTSSSKIRR